MSYDMVLLLILTSFVTVGCVSSAAPGLYDCYGDVARLSPLGASGLTSRQYGFVYTGLKASQRMVDNDRGELDAMADCFQVVGRKNCIHPAVIAALASRESGGGRRLTDGWGGRHPDQCDSSLCPLCQDGRCSFGILQCDVKNSRLRSGCLIHAWNSCEHIDMMIREQLVINLEELRHQHEGEAGWSPETLLLGGIDAYNTGIHNVGNLKDIDSRTTGGDFSNDVVARAQHLIKTRPWASEGGICSLDGLAAARDCRFYQCLEQHSPCGEDGYAVGYGDKFCRTARNQSSELNNKGKTWLNNVSGCMMRGSLVFHANPGRKCETMKETALTDHVTCFIQHGFCSNIMGEESNWQPFLKIFQEAGFTEADKLIALQQVIETARACVNHHYTDQPIIPESAVDSFLTDINNLLLDEPHQQLNSTESCDELAANGDCGFYECVDRRHQCRDDVKHSQVLHFELTHCRELERSNEYNDQILDFVSKYQRCLMNVTLPITNRPSVRCNEFYIELSRQRQECLEQAGICNHGDLGMLLYRGFSLDGYPTLTPDFMNNLWSEKRDVPVPMFYFRHLTLLRSRVGDVICKCSANPQGRCKSFYTRVFNSQNRVYHLVESEKRGNRGDTRCTEKSGTCEMLPRRCDGNYLPGLCSGPVNRQCCVSN